LLPAAHNFLVLGELLITEVVEAEWFCGTPELQILLGKGETVQIRARARVYRIEGVSRLGLPIKG
jgi:hypothetical protein